MFNGKRGLSAIIATISLVLLTFVAVAIIAGFIVPFVTENIEGGTECFNYRDYFSFEEEFGLNCYDNTAQAYAVSVRTRGVEESLEENIGGFKVVFIKGGSTDSMDVVNNQPANSEVGMLDGSQNLEIPGAGEVITYTYRNPEQFDSMEIYPTLSSGKVCDRSDVIRMENQICEDDLDIPPPALAWALDFNGDGDHVRIGTGAQFDDICLGDGCSFSAWVLRRGTEDGNLESIIGRYKPSGSGDKFFRLIFDESKDLVFEVYADGSTASVCSSTQAGSALSQARPYHIVGVYDNVTDQISIYVDGFIASQDVCSMAVGPWAMESTNIGQIGSGGAGTGYWNGTIDEVRIYNTPLSPGEVNEIFSSGSVANNSLSSSGLVAWYTFDEGSGTVLGDSAGSFSGDITGAVWV